MTDRRFQRGGRLKPHLSLQLRIRPTQKLRPFAWPGAHQATAPSEQVRGDGDAARNRIYAAAYERDPEFFAFYRTMQAYENALPVRNTRMLLTPNSDFFRYFGDPMGKIRGPEGPR